VVGSIPTSALKYKIMYETLEHWKQYKQEKELQLGENKNGTTSKKYWN